MDVVAPENSFSLLKRIYRDYLSSHLGRVGVAFILMAIAAGMTGFQAFLMEPVINDIFVNKDQTKLVPLGVAVFVAFILRGVSTWGQVTLMAKVGQSILATIQRQMFDKVIRTDLNFFHNNPSGALISRFMSDVQTMRIAVAEGLTGFGKSILTLIFLVAVMFYRDWQLSFMAFVIFPMAMFVVSYIGKKIRLISGDTQAEMADFSAYLNQIFQGIRHVKANVMERHEIERADKRIEKLYKLNYKIIRTSALSTPMSETMAGIAVVAIIIYGGYQVIIGNSTPGAFFSFITAFIMAYEPMKKLAKLNNAVQTGLAAADRVFGVMDQTATITEKKDAVELKTTSPEITVESLSFSYPDGTQALSDLSMTIKPDTKVALVGASGSGKSTLINLIPRFYDVQEGAIKIDGIDIRNVTLDSLRNSISLVSQDIAIFDESVKENIIYGANREVSEAEIIEAAKKANAHDFIQELEEGYETRLGENGVRLSGGQKQRIAIARAILRDAPILLLDEATSALDTEAERIVSEGINSLQKGRTTILVAHRLSTVVDSDWIYVLSEGRVVEEGTHVDLMKLRGIYADLYGTQSAA